MLAPQDSQQPPRASQQAGVPTPSPSKLTSAAVRAELVAQIRGLAEVCGAVPDICKRRLAGEPGFPAPEDPQVADWDDLRRRKQLNLMQAYPTAGLHPSTFVPTSQATPSLPDGGVAAGAGMAGGAPGTLPMPVQPMMPASGSAQAPPAMPAPSRPAERATGSNARPGKVAKPKQKPGGRTFTSKYRGVHQTFPTRRWEAQFRRNGKPTSLGCFDQEEQAARAYDKMMLWCELHNATGVKGGITNFDNSAYESDVPYLQSCTQDDLVTALRGEGRKQAAQRMMKQKKEGAAANHKSDSEDE